MQKINLYKYSIKFKRNPFAFEIKERAGLILLFEKNGCIIRSAEIAPLKHFSKESLQEAQEQTLWLLKNLSKTNVTINEALKISNPYRLYSSVQWAIYRLFNDESRQKTLKNDEGDSLRIPMNLLVSDDLVKISESNSLIQYWKSRIQSSSFVKIKIGRKLNKENFHKNRELIRQESEMINNLVSKNSSIKLILDANRNLNLELLSEYYSLINKEHLLYFEDPLYSIEDTIRSLELGRIPLALDESLADLHAVPDYLYLKIKAFVLKPTILGYSKVFHLMDIARKNNIVLTLSSAFESIIGIADLIQFFYETPEFSSSFAGLDTLKYFEDHEDFYSYEKDYLQINRGSTFRYFEKINTHLIEQFLINN